MVREHASAALRVEESQTEHVHSPLLQELEQELHDLCQPVTSLQCRLEIGKLSGDPAALLEAVDGALEDATRLFAVVTRMRDRLLAVDAALAREQE